MTGSARSQSYGMQHWRPGYVTASLDGKPVAPLLPGLKERSHVQGSASSSYRRRSGGSPAVSWAWRRIGHLRLSARTPVRTSSSVSMMIMGRFLAEGIGSSSDRFAGS